LRQFRAQAPAVRYEPAAWQKHHASSLFFSSLSIKHRQSRHNQRIDCSKNIDRRPIFQRNQKDPQAPSESIKSVYDQWEEPRYVLSGSSQLLLLEKVKESLAGRCTIIDLYPLTIPELSDEDRFEWLANYVRTYLERDVRDLAAFRDLEPFVKLQRLVALQTASILNYSAVGHSISVTSKTVQRYIQYLELSYQALVLSSWTKNEAKRLVKAPKIHVLDYGVLQAVVQKRGSPTGPEFESLVIAELYKQAKTMRSDARFWYLRTLDGREVDLLIELSQGYLAFEIKTSERAALSDVRHLRSVSGLLDKPLLHAFVLSNDPAAQLLTPTITALHAAQLLG
jgi:hypothetical protein